MFIIVNSKNTVKDEISIYWGLGIPTSLNKICSDGESITKRWVAVSKQVLVSHRATGGGQFGPNYQCLFLDLKVFP